MTTDESATTAAEDSAVVPSSPTGRDTGITLTELLASFYLWLVLWLVAWAAVPALVIGWQPVLITSGSMGPTISPGDLVLLGEPPNDELLATGTVITYRDPGRSGGLITHRIDGVREDGMYRTRGDANGSPDSAPVAHEDVVGVARLLVPLVGLPVQWLRTDVVSFGLFLAGTLAAAIAAGTANRAGRERSRQDDPDAGGAAHAGPDDDGPAAAERPAP